MTTLERAARAITDTPGNDGITLRAALRGMGTLDDAMLDRMALGLARAVLASLLPPDEGMVEPGAKACDIDSCGADLAFPAMIRHAMGEG